MKNICVVTSNRADFGQLYWLMKGLQENSGFNLQVIATGGHFFAQQGYSWRAIESSGFRIDCKVEVAREEDSGAAVGVEMAAVLSGVSKALVELRPDLMVVLGDRYEILAAVSAAILQNIPVAHLHGGELTLGAFDDSIRHAISKLSNLHFVAAEAYRNRVIQLGEEPSRVFNVGAFGLDAIEKCKLLNEDEIRKKLRIPQGRDYVILTWHPETRSLDLTEDHFHVLLSAVKRFKNLFIVFTRPNNDPQGKGINRILDDYAFDHPEDCRVFDSLGMVRFLSALKYSRGMIGNSSSGLIEAPAMNVPTVNVGDRQTGRLRASSILDCLVEEGAIFAAVDKLVGYTSSTFDVTENPYGNGGASEKTIVELQRILFSNSLNMIKPFHDLSI